MHLSSILLTTPAPNEEKKVEFGGSGERGDNFKNVGGGI